MKSFSRYIILITFMGLYAMPTKAQKHWLDSAKRVLRTQKADTNKVYALININSVYTVNAPDSALLYGQQALALAERLDFDYGKFWSIVAINKALYPLGNYALELDYAFKAFPLGKKLNNAFTIGWANGMLGDCFFNLGDYPTCLKYYRKVVRAAERDSIIDLSSIYGALTPVFVKMKQYDSALYYAKKGYALFKSIPSLNVEGDDNKVMKGYQFRFLGEAFASNNQYDSALFYYWSSLNVTEALDMNLNKFDVFNGIAGIYKNLKQFDSAIYYAKKITSEKSAKSYPVSLLIASHLLADVYESKTNPDSSLKYLHLALNINDSLYNREKMMAAQNIIFKEQEKQTEITATKSKLQSEYRTYFLIGFLVIAIIIAGIVIKNRRQLQLQQIRNNIADDLHDDIGSTLSSITIMSELAKKKSPGAISLLDAIEESTISLQENMSDIVWAVNPKNDRFENVLHRMNQFASEILNAKNIELDFSNDDSLIATRLTMAQRKNFYLFFKEVVNNAAKYSNAKKLSVRISKKEHQLEMKISDNGKGFDLHNGYQGNGMNTLKRRAAELSAYFDLQSILNEGTYVQLKFKIT